MQDAEESGEDFAEEIDEIRADEDEPSEPEAKKRKVCPTPRSATLSSLTGNSELRRRQPPPSLRRRKQSRLRVVPRRSSQLMRKMTEIYLAYDNVSDPRLRCSVSPLLSACCPLICMLSYTVIIPYVRILPFSKPSQKYLLVFVSPFNIIS